MKNLVVSVFAALSLSAAAQINLDEGLILYYPLDGNANDAGPLNLNGSPALLWGEDYQGNSNGAAIFNGTNSYIDIPHNPILKPQLPVSFSFYVKLNSSNVQQGWIFNTNYSPNSYHGVFCNIDNARIQFSFGDGDANSTSSSARRTKTLTKSLDLGVWYHIVGVVRNSTDMSIYVDCTEEPGTYSGTGGNISYNNDPGSIGRGDVAGFSPYYFDGALDDFRYWNRALSDDEVIALCEMVTSNGPSLESGALNFYVFPNPSSGTFQIALPSQITDGILVTVSDCRGAIVYIKYHSGPTEEFLQVNTPNLMSGIYNLNITDGTNRISKKLIIHSIVN